MNESRRSQGLIKLKSMIYVFGGWVDTAENYDINTDTWTLIDNTLPQAIRLVN